MVATSEYKYIPSDGPFGWAMMTRPQVQSNGAASPWWGGCFPSALISVICTGWRSGRRFPGNGAAFPLCPAGPSR